MKVRHVMILFLPHSTKERAWTWMSMGVWFEEPEGYWPGW